MLKPGEQVGGPCTVCGIGTRWACSDCKIDTSTSVYVCSRRACREKHDENCTRKPVPLQ